MELKHPVLFWVSALLIAAVFAAATPLVLPYDALRLDSPVDRERAWLLTVFTGGAMAVLFGLSGLISGPRLLSVRDVAEAGGIAQARRLLRRAGETAEASSARLNFAVWLVATGVFLIGIYFILWRALG